MHLPNSKEKWIKECKRVHGKLLILLCSYMDGFHVHMTIRLKNYFSFKNKYTVTRIGLVGYKKRFLHLATGAPGNMHDARLLRHTSSFKEISNGRGGSRTAATSKMERL